MTSMREEWGYEMGVACLAPQAFRSLIELRRPYPQTRSVNRADGLVKSLE